MTYKQLADQIGLSANAVGAYVTDKAEPRLSGLVKIADALGVSIDQLLRPGKKHVVTVGQLIDLIDYNREGEEQVKIIETDDRGSTVFTDAVMLDRIGNCTVDSIGVDYDGIIEIWLTDEAVKEHWERRNK